MPDTPSSILLIASLAESLLNFRGELIDLLVANGFTVHTAAPNAPDHLIQALNARGVEYHDYVLDRNGTRLAADLRSVVQLRRLVRTIKPNLVMPYTAKPILYSALALGWDSSIRFVPLITGLGAAFSSHHVSRNVQRLVSRLYRFAIRRSNCVIFQNRDDLRDLRRMRVVREVDRCAIVEGSGINLEKFSYHSSPEKPRFLMISRLVRSKGVIEYLTAAEEVRSRNENIEFALVGWPENGPDALDEAEVKARANAAGLDYIDYMDDVREQLRRCTVYVLPSYREGLPRTVLEAMATGRAIVTSDAPGCRETVTHARNGFLVPVGDVKSLSEAMEKLGRDGALSKRMGVESRRIAEARFDVQLVNEKMMNILTGVL